MSKIEKMEEEEDDEDLMLQRASNTAITDVKLGIANLVAEDFRRRITPKLSESRSIINQLELFQEDPQLLDPHLVAIVLPLAKHCLALIQERDLNDDGCAMFDTVAEVLYTLCKVRGEKVITRFLNNEPRYLIPMLRVCKTAFADGCDTSLNTTNQQDIGTPLKTSWQRRYILLLWLYHLTLTPFDLSTIFNRTSFDPLPISMNVPAELPPIALDIIQLCLKSIDSATKEQHVSASLLARVALRPDMQKLGLLNSLVVWSLEQFANDREEPASIHGDIGRLLFFNALVRSADLEAVHLFLPALYDAVERIAETGTGGFQGLRSSGVSRILLIKIQRNIIVQLLKVDHVANAAMQNTQGVMENTGAVENVIDFLMTSLADRDTQVRYAASKALSVITVKLENSMVEDVTQAIIDSYEDDVFVKDGRKHLTSVNPQKWHGLTLTLSHLLFRRSPSPALLPRIIQKLFLALTFEQRSPSGNSIGGNVRDAANFGLWSLARRYTTTELMTIEPTHAGLYTLDSRAVSSLQSAACQLLMTACLDPVGNVRRGSSAALQEMIGRHPNTIKEGIPLVQAVDYHSVGLRSRAMTEVTVNAALLGVLYRQALMESLYGWRGVGAPDAVSRRLAATAIGSLTCLQTDGEIQSTISQLIDKLEKTSQQNIEERHSLILTLAAILNRCHSLSTLEDEVGAFLIRLWKLFEATIHVTPKDLLASQSRPELLVEAVITYVAALAQCSLSGNPHQDLRQGSVPSSYIDGCLRSFSLCLTHESATDVQILPFAARHLLQVVDEKCKAETMQFWITNLSSARASSSSGIMLAIGASWSTLSSTTASDHNEFSAIQSASLRQLLSRSTAAEVEVRVHAVRSLAFLIDSSADDAFADPSFSIPLLETLHFALNDYTINERGDVGSLVRIEGLLATERVWSKSSAVANVATDGLRSCTWAVHRLALEKLDKVRLQAARCLASAGLDLGSRIENLSDVSSYDYFVRMSILILLAKTPTSSDAIPPVNAPYITLLSGFATSAGTGAESLQQTARPALHDILTALSLSPLSTSIPSSSPSLLGVGAALLTLLSDNLTNDRLLHPLLELTVFLLDSNALHPLLLTSPAPPSFKPLSLLSLVQKAHYKSTSLPKLLACVSIYRSLADVPAIRVQVLTKLVGMLGHPFPSVRVASAEALWVATAEEALKGWDWSIAGKEGKNKAEEIKGLVLKE